MDGKFKVFGQIVLMVMMSMPLIDQRMANVWLLVMTLAKSNYSSILVHNQKVDVSNTQDTPLMSVESSSQIVVSISFQWEVTNYQYFNGDISSRHPD